MVAYLRQPAADPGADDPNLARWNASVRGPVVTYKAARTGAPRLTKADRAAPKCLCCYPVATPGQLVPLRFGVRIALCGEHRDPAFLRRRGGRDFLASVSETFRSLGLTGLRYGRALQAFVDDLRLATTPTPRPRPGSYAWPHLRRAAEVVWSAGGSFHAGEAAVLDLHEPDLGTARPPSRQTVRRWWRQRRWLIARPAPPRPAPAPPLRDTRALVRPRATSTVRPIERPGSPSLPRPPGSTNRR